MKSFIFKLFRAAYTIVWACLMFSVGILTMLNHNVIMTRLSYATLVGVALLATFVLYKLWDIKEEGETEEDYD